jgi:hypothetical protein
VSSHRQPQWLVNAKRLFFTYAVTTALLIAAYSWSQFHPALAVEFIGPTGAQNPAFIENRSFQDIGYTLCVSDWPYTFLKPLSMESVMYSEGSDCRVFWSVDGSAIVALDSDSSEYRAAYDFTHHQLIRYDTPRMQALIDARGGLGLEFSDYRDGKETYHK